MYLFPLRNEITSLTIIIKKIHDFVSKNFCHIMYFRNNNYRYILFLKFSKDVRKIYFLNNVKDRLIKDFIV